MVPTRRSLRCSIFSSTTSKILRSDLLILSQMNTFHRCQPANRLERDISITASRSRDEDSKPAVVLEAQREAVHTYLKGGRWPFVQEFVEIESGKRNDRPPTASLSSPIEIFIATGPKEPDRRGPGHAVNVRKSQALHQLVNFRRHNRLVGITAHPIVYVVNEVHAADAVIIGDMRSKVAAHQGEGRSQEPDVNRTGTSLRLQGCTSVPALFPSPEPAHHRATIEREREDAIWRDQPRRGAHCVMHGAGVMQHAPGIDHVRGSQLADIVAVENRAAFDRPFAIAGEMQIAQPRGAEDRGWVKIERMHTRAEPARGERKKPTPRPDIDEARARQRIASEQATERALRLRDLACAQIAGEVEPVVAEPETNIFSQSVRHIGQNSSSSLPVAIQRPAG